MEREYENASGGRTRASDEAVKAVLAALGVPAEDDDAVAAALAAKRRERVARTLPRTVVAWDGAAAVEVTLPEEESEVQVDGELRSESGDVLPVRTSLRGVRWLRRENVAGTWFVTKRVRFGERWPLGYHRLVLRIDGRAAEAHVVAAPREAPAPDDPHWGFFMPLGALHSARSWGMGDFGDLDRLVQWAADLGGSVVALLPLYPLVLEPGREPSPYGPVARRFLNEAFLDVDAALQDIGAGSRPPPASLRSRLDRLRAGTSADPAGVARVKREALEAVLAALPRDAPARRAMEAFARDRPLAEAYARFRSATERLGPWHTWASPELPAADGAATYHLFAQWLAHEQLRRVVDRARGRGVRLLLDLPIGSDPDGFGAWRDRHLFAEGVSIGAPPDPFFVGGQDWGFRPLHPERLAETGYRHVAEALHAAFEFAGALRIDHVLGLHRLYWVPAGRSAKDGAYVHYDAEALYAVAALEAHRAGAWVVGEDLGTVPPYVRPMLDAHRFLRTHVVELEASTDDLPEAPRNSAALLGTHDMPPFAAWWDAHDIALRREKAWIDATQAEEQREAREATKAMLVDRLREAGFLAEDAVPDAVFRALLRWLAEGPARVVLVTLEDLWLETVPFNTPGIPRPENWRRRSRASFEEFSRDPAVLATLRTVDALRRSRGAAW